MSARLPWVRGGDLAADALRRLGVELTATISGAQVMSIYDAVARSGGIRLVVPRSERGAAVIAEGYAAACGVPAAVVSTVGVGVINELPGIASAARAGRPLLSLSPGQPRPKRARIREVFQGVDHEAVYAPHCEYRYVDDFDDIVAAIGEAASAALGPPAGPVHLDISFPELFRRRLRRSHYGRDVDALTRLRPASDAGLAAGRVWVADDVTLLEEAGIDTGLTPGLERCGLATAFAIGAALAPGRRRVALILSATDLVAGAAELDTARRHDARLDLIVLSDASLDAKGLLHGYGVGDGGPISVRIVDRRELTETCAALAEQGGYVSESSPVPSSSL